ncbi:MAG: sporulation protein [Raineya sp.]|jgi:hypothetical protein|nr:sporulation protein [Raineya sp.]
MSFLAKIKQFFGLGTVSVKLQMPNTFKIEDGQISGKILVEGKSDQTVTEVEVEFKENWTTGRGDDKKEKELELGTIKLPGFTIKSGEKKEIDFTLPFTYSKSSNEDMASKGGVMGGLGKLAQFADGEKSTFKVLVTVDVKGATFDPNDSLELKKIK